jgi:hypothetical protein
LTSKPAAAAVVKPVTPPVVAAAAKTAAVKVAGPPLTPKPTVVLKPAAVDAAIARIVLKASAPPVKILR